ncbi:MAG: UDP-N-acetylmuramoyl-tripeptide--D-alanyl-D-alanine ligase [Verrucomicrobiae bacterium]|nr:UDP-N-acetylmuramoyl-tripeptide--D-alanyl-D-alanine ligase [Verrucomicrobiae bacterium]
MEKLTLGMITEFTSGELHDGDKDAAVEGFSIDTRTLQPRQVFVALRGEKSDGHEHIEAAKRAGALAAIVARDRLSGLPAGIPKVIVNEPLLGLQMTASRYRQLLPVRTIAITGSNGKTSTKELVSSVLAQKYRLSKTEGNFNNHIGVPLSLLQLRPDDELGVFEIGMNHAGELAPLIDMILPEIGVITNVGTAHIEFFKDEAGIAQEKGTLAEKTPANGAVVLNRDNLPWSDQIAARTKAKVLWFGLDPSAAFRAERLMPHEKGTDFQLVTPDSRIDVNFQWPGRHQVYNALAAAAVGWWFGLNLRQIREGLESARPPKMRMQTIVVGDDIRILNDAYNANPESMRAALEAFQRITARGRKIAVLGEMRELGRHSQQAHQTIGRIAAQSGCDVLVTVGSDGVWMAKGAVDAGLKPERLEQFVNAAEAGKWLKDRALPGDLILLKGSRGNRLEAILEYWK